MNGLNEIRRGMTIYSSEGEKLGKVVDVQEDFLLVEKGFLFPKDYAVRAQDIGSITGDDVTLLVSKEALKARTEELGSTPWGLGSSNDAATNDTLMGQAPIGRAGTTAAPDRSAGASMRTGATEEMRVPVAEEQLDVLKRETETGSVRVHKEVVEEQKTISVPVLKEEIHVERVAVDPNQPLPAGASAFQREDVVVPVHEEEIEVRKRPVVTEEVVIRKDRAYEERRVAEGLRKEEVRVSDSDEDLRTRRSHDDDPLRRT